MIVELAELRIKPGRQLEFDVAIARGISTVLSRSPGYRGHRVHRGIEAPDRYVLMVFWESVDHHTKGFRESALFDEWCAIVEPYFSQPPVVEHFSLLTGDTV